MRARTHLATSRGLIRRGERVDGLPQAEQERFRARGLLEPAAPEPATPEPATPEPAEAKGKGKGKGKAVPAGQEPGTGGILDIDPESCIQ